jgi:hypothetical protein
MWKFDCGNAVNPKLLKMICILANFDFRIFDAFVNFKKEVWADLISRVLKIDTCHLGFKQSICISDSVRKNWAQTLKSGFSKTKICRGK